MLGGAQTQPNTHDTEVVVHAGGWDRRFTIFYKNHKCLLLNIYVPSIGKAWKGDILIMQRAQNTPHGYVHLRSQDQPLAQRAVEA